MEGGFMGMKRIYSKELVAKALKETGWLTTSEMEQHPDLPSYTTVLNLFKTNKINDVWNELSIPFPSNYTKKSVAKALKKTGYLITNKINEHPDLPVHTTVYKLFKTNKMSDVWNELGFPQPTYTKESVSKALKEIGYLKSSEIAQHPDLPSRPTILKLFKTTKINDVWNELDIPFPLNYTKESVSKALKEIGWLTTREFDKHPNLPSLTTVYKLFKTIKMNDVWKELGIPFTPKR